MDYLLLLMVVCLLSFWFMYRFPLILVSKEIAKIKKNQSKEKNMTNSLAKFEGKNGLMLIFTKTFKPTMLLYSVLTISIGFWTIKTGLSGSYDLKIISQFFVSTIIISNVTDYFSLTLYKLFLNSFIEKYKIPIEKSDKMKKQLKKSEKYLKIVLILTLIFLVFTCFFTFLG